MGYYLLLAAIDHSACSGPPKDRDAIRYAAEQIMNDRDFAAAVVQWHGQAGRFVVVGGRCLGEEDALQGLKQNSKSIIVQQQREQ